MECSPSTVEAGCSVELVLKYRMGAFVSCDPLPSWMALTHGLVIGSKRSSIRSLICGHLANLRGGNLNVKLSCISRT